EIRRGETGRVEPGEVRDDSDGRDRPQSASVVEGTNEGPVAGMGGGLAGLDPRLVRLHDLPADHAADFAGVQCSADGRDLCVYDHAVDAPRRRGLLRLARRSPRAATAADDLDPRLFRVQLHRRLLANLLVSVPVPRAPRLLHGRGMAGRRRVGHGAMAATLARLYEWGSAGIVGHRLFAVERGLRAALQLDRLARLPVDRRSS